MGMVSVPVGVVAPAAAVSAAGAGAAAVSGLLAAAAGHEDAVTANAMVSAEGQ